MSEQSFRPDPEAPAIRASVRLFAATVFAGAFLLFLVQPLIGKFILPWFGGTPAVWTTCMVFFQVLLLAGYAYAHLTTRLLPPRGQAAVHLVLLLAALALLPITPDAKWKPLTPDDPLGRILRLLLVCLGLPYFGLSATGPLMQAWFARLHPGVSPYRLYALSNVGSLLALVSFPFWFEPAFSRQTQAWLWSGGLVVFFGLCGACAVRLWRLNPPEFTAVVADGTGEGAGAAATPAARLLWLALPACASALLLAVTNQIAQDVAVIPFLWVLPLGLYLLSFIFAFDRAGSYRRVPYLVGSLLAVGILCGALFEGFEIPLVPQIVAYGGALFLCAMVCHGELFRLRPPPRALTGYYLMIAAGGALGGLFVGVAAPLLFHAYLELHWTLGAFALLVLCILAREKAAVTIRNRRLRLWPAALTCALILGAVLTLQARHAMKRTIAASRNFYGVLRVFAEDVADPWERHFALRHGGITHGFQYRHPERAALPTTYYHADGGAGLMLRHFPWRGGRRCGVVGLGVGTVAAFAERDDVFRFYEIDPDVKRFAENHFTFLSGCVGRVEVALGDARLSLEREAPQEFDFLILDAFSSDAIPVHLLTKEAFDIYLRHLKRDGVIAVHITNRHLNLQPVVEKIARHRQLASALIAKEVNLPPWAYSSRWLLLTTNQAFLDLEEIRSVTGEPWKNLDGVPLWTDDNVSLFRVLR